jgi:hypothetical protein
LESGTKTTLGPLLLGSGKYVRERYSWLIDASTPKFPLGKRLSQFVARYTSLRVS